MQSRYRLTRDKFIQRGLEQNAEERRRLGIPAEVQQDPEQAWTALYGTRKWVYLDLDGSLIQYGGKGQIVDDEVGNGNYGALD